MAALPQQHPQTTALGVLLDVLQRTGWRKVATPSDRYLVGQDAAQLEPIRAKGATGHAPARVVAMGGTVSLTTYDWHGVQLDCCSWAYITPHNLERALDYMHRATEESMGA